jgi:hypothetical protein
MDVQDDKKKGIPVIKTGKEIRTLCPSNGDR